ncbi:hypothetical protein [Paraburkholderia acidisoli]|jgi:hypothetical protein|uniref:Uncharacterized protein n=1 Tax=Paraburkholderia acidisoli TaxID=2571748 RepID=A0A7Z2GNG7_9BURK|nr:hypothetical protein [Paraburkholderia acidisoli]QGZ64963.1 hypothetical protein FAZ98_24495 [Paraburkholderia acidisoli]
MHLEAIEVARLHAAVRANIDDARVWRWYADLMEDERVSCTRTRGGWQVTVDGRASVEDDSFDGAVRRAAQLWSGLAQAQPKLHRRRKTAANRNATANATLLAQVW